MGLLCLGLHSPSYGQNIYGNAAPDQDTTTPNPPVFRDDRPALRNDGMTTPYTTQVLPVGQTSSSVNATDQTTPVETKQPEVQTEPESPASISPTATANSLFKINPALTLSDQTSLSTNSQQQSLGPLVAPNSGNGRVFAPGFRVGAFNLKPNLSTSTVFDDNLNSAADGSPNKISDIAFNLTPSLSAEYQTDQDTDAFSFSGTYTPTVQALLDHSSEDSVQQSLGLSAGYRYTKLSLGMRETLYTLNGGSALSGDLAPRTISDTSLYANYELGEKTSIEASTDLGSREIDSSSSYTTFNPNVSAYINYQYLPKLTLGIGLTAGVTFVQAQSNQYNLGPSLRAIYDYSEKTKVFAQVGFSYTDYGGSISDTLNADFQLGGEYQVTPLVKLNLSGERSQQVSNSLYGQDTINTSISTGVTYTLLKHYGISLNGGFQNISYIPSTSDEYTDRTDNYLFISPGLSYSPLEYWDLSMNYSFRDNISSQSVNSYTDNQFSLSSSIRF